MKLDLHQLGPKKIKVAISNPPKKAAAVPQFGHNNEGEIPAIKGSGGGGGGSGGGREDSEGFRKPSFIPSQARRSKAHASYEPDPL